MDLIFAFPGLIMALVIASILGPSLTNAMIAIGIVIIPTFARTARAPVLFVKELEYVQAARCAGASNLRIVFRHIVPNIATPLIVQATITLSAAILIEASLSFLGLGTQPPTPSWGTMLGSGRRFLETAPWVAMFPGLAIMIAVLGFNLMGDGLRDYLDPQYRVQMKT
jgi:peptide/nickel transport system permease protein